MFGPSKRYISTSRIDLPILIVRRDGKEDVLTVPTYLVDAEVPFLCGKETLEDWNFHISGREKILEITSPTEGLRIQIQMIDTQGGHYGIVLETQRRQNVLYIEDSMGDELGFSSLKIKNRNFVHLRLYNKCMKSIGINRRIS